MTATNDFLPPLTEKYKFVSFLSSRTKYAANFFFLKWLFTQRIRKIFGIIMYQTILLKCLTLVANACSKFV